MGRQRGAAPRPPSPASSTRRTRPALLAGIAAALPAARPAAFWLGSACALGASQRRPLEALRRGARSGAGGALAVVPPGRPGRRLACGPRLAPVAPFAAPRPGTPCRSRSSPGLREAPRRTSPGAVVRDQVGARWRSQSAQISRTSPWRWSARRRRPCHALAPARRSRSSSIGAGAKRWAPGISGADQPDRRRWGPRPGSRPSASRRLRRVRGVRPGLAPGLWSRVGTAVPCEVGQDLSPPIPSSADVAQQKRRPGQHRAGLHVPHRS